jgi:predicted short-subunit dehydrogenase-like oxidoreductase (DUF2520 family)
MNIFGTAGRCVLRSGVEQASVMLPGMAEKPSIALVGAGSLATALAISLRRAGYRIDAVVAREAGSSLMRARRLARRVRAHVVVRTDRLNAKILWLCVPDSEIAYAAASLAETFRGKGRIALHSSGALTSDELEPLRSNGAAVASAHPLMTFVKGSRPSLAGVPIALEGDTVAVRAARAVVRELGGEAYILRKEDKNAYHAWGMFASPLLTALLATSEQVARLAGVRGAAARRRMLPILLRTVENYGSLGAAKGFSGPVVRGDVETVRRHLEVLRRVTIPREVYLALARAAIEYLPAKNKEALKQLLET